MNMRFRNFNYGANSKPRAFLFMRHRNWLPFVVLSSDTNAVIYGSIETWGIL